MPVGDIARDPADRKHRGKHVHRNTDRAHDDAGVEIDVRVEFAGDEVVILERGLLKVLRNLEERIVDPELSEQRAAGLTDDLGPRVEVAIHGVTKAHEAIGFAAGFGGRDEAAAVVPLVVNRLEHVHDGGVGPAVQRTREGADAGRD